MTADGLEQIEARLAMGRSKAEDVAALLDEVRRLQEQLVGHEAVSAGYRNDSQENFRTIDGALKFLHRCHDNTAQAALQAEAQNVALQEQVKALQQAVEQRETHLRAAQMEALNLGTRLNDSYDRSARARLLADAQVATLERQLQEQGVLHEFPARGPSLSSDG